MKFSRLTAALLLSFSTASFLYPQTTIKLEPGSPITDRIGGGQSRSYSVALEAGQYLEAVVDQQGVDVVVQVSDPADKEVLRVDSPNGTDGPESVFLIANLSGLYRLNVAALDASAPLGNYQARLVRRAVPTEVDRDRAEAARLVNDSDRLRAEPGKDSPTQVRDAYSRAADLFHRAGALINEIYALQGAAAVSNGMNDLTRGIGYYERALAIARQLKAARAEISLLETIGSDYEYAGNMEKATGYFEQMLAIARESGYKPEEALALNYLGGVYVSSNETGKAIAYFEQALAISRSARDLRGEAGALGNLSEAFMAVGDYSRAVQYDEQALPIWRVVKDRQGEGRTLNDLGTSYEGLGLHKKSLDVLESALPIARDAGDRAAEAGILNGIGETQQGLSRWEEALTSDAQALAIWRELNQPQGVAVSLNDAGMVYVARAQYEKAIGNLKEALPIAHSLGGGLETKILSNLGTTYAVLGQGQVAIEYLTKALELEHAHKDRRSEGRTMNSIGAAYLTLRQPEKAREYFEQALPVVREARDRTAESGNLSSLGAVYGRLGQHAKAVGYFEQALVVARDFKDRRVEAFALHNTASEYGELGEYQKAISYGEQALVVERATGNRALEAFSLDRLCTAWQALGNPRLAIFYGKQSVNMLQAIRSDIGGLDQTSRESYVNQFRHTYRSLADLMIAQGRLAEAQQVLDLLKGTEYFNFIRRDQAEAGSLSGRADLTGDESDWAKRYREIADRLTGSGTRYGELRASENLTPEQERELSALENDLRVGNQAFQAFLGSLTSHFSAKIASAASVADLRDTEALQETLAQLKHGAVAVYTLVGDQKYRAILVTPTVQRAYEYPIAAVDLNRKIEAFREAVQDPARDPRPLAEELYHILIVPALAEDLRQAKAETVMWSLDGALRYLPLAALYDGKRFLIERYRLPIFTPASGTRLTAEPVRERWTVLGLGVTKPREGFPALPNVAGELNGIVRDGLGRHGAVPGRVLLDEAFTAAAMKDQLRHGYPLVHIATHFRFQPGDETKSVLLLGDGELSLAEIRTTPQLFTGVELLALSACNTGIGDGDGSEVEGFGVMAQRKGAKTVIASLWSVADESTSLLMRTFYDLLESSPNMLKSEALRQAQLALLHGRVGSPSTQQQRRGLTPKSGQPARLPAFTHPYHWASFLMMGNWR